MNYADSRNYLHVVSDHAYKGQNFQQAYAKWTPINDASAGWIWDNVFQYGGKTYRGDWVSDGGDLAAPESTRERRMLTTTGKARITVRGTSIAIRVSLNPQWGKATILLNGQAPSSYAGVVNARDTLSCLADDYGSWGNEFRDVVIAENLPLADYEIQIICYQNSATGFFVFSGVKVYDLSNAGLDKDLWSVDWSERKQRTTLQLEYRGTDSVEDVTLEMDPRLVDSSRQALGTQAVGRVMAGAPYSITADFNLLGTEPTGEIVYDNIIHALYPDPAGAVTKTVVNDAPGSAPAFTYTGTWWEDAATATLPLLRAGQTRGQWVTFQNYGDSFTIDCYTDFGLASAYVLKDVVTFTGIATTASSNKLTLPNTNGVKVGQTVACNRITGGVTVIDVTGNQVTLSANVLSAGASNVVAFGTLVGRIDTNEPNAAKQQTMQRKTVTGLGANYNGTVMIQNGSTKYFGFARIQYTTSKPYTQVHQHFTIKGAVQQIPPYPVEGVRLENGRIKWDPVDLTKFDVTSDDPHDNRNTQSVQVEYRFPTFICCYTAGFVELFKQYDVVITDPGALTRQETKELQDLGIIVLMYVSFGEEDGVLSNIWDHASDQGPHVGDGAGPGGKASYYMKGGYHYGELGECSHDRQRLDGVKDCSLSNPNYITGTGRCSKACSWDWREGYLSWQNGGACGKGFTSANKWQRDASNACSNSTCPQYSPLNGKCPQYDQAQDVWGQDFSMVETTTPDENGIWKSYYVNPIPRTPGSWFAKLRDYYLPLVFNEPSEVTETQVVAQYTLSDNVTKVLGVRMSQAPMDEAEPFHVKHVSTGYVYTPNIDYSFDKMLGTVTLSVQPDPGNPAAAPVPVVGDQIELYYHKRGLGADGVFMDTVDTVDVYPRDDYQTGAAALINELKALHPTRQFCSNRGFTIYDKMIKSCSWIMTESVFSDYDFNAGTYQLVSGASEQWNNDVTKMIQQMRREHTFDVVCLNYAPNTSDGDAIRAAVNQKTMDLGWLGWLSTILLNDPLPNNKTTRDHGHIRTNDWKPTRVIPIKKVT